MTEVDQNALEDLLRHAAPRPTPSTEDEAAVRAAVQNEWRGVVGKRRTHRRVARYAIAATVLVGVFAAFNAFRTPVVATIQVATIEKSFGSVYVLSEQSELRPTDDLSNVLSGQTIVTGNDAGLALAWDNGGSIRVDANTRIEFTDSNSVFVEEGRIYFDSMSSTLLAGIDAGGSPAFTLETPNGAVQHIGTQFMTAVDNDSLVVSVREGRVLVDGSYHEQTATSGQQVTLVGRQRPNVLSIERAGEAWAWVGRTTPAADVDGKTLHEFLVWVCREMGLDLKFEGKAEAVAHDAVLKGTIDTVPADALRLRLATADLQSRIEGGAIYISDNPQ